MPVLVDLTEATPLAHRAWPAELAAPRTGNEGPGVMIEGAGVSLRIVLGP